MMSRSSILPTCLINSLVIAGLQSRRPPSPIVQFSYRDLKHLSRTEFEARLSDSVLFTATANTLETLATQLQTVVTECLDQLATFKTVRRRASKQSAKWLNADAVAAKRRRRKLERAWQCSRSEADRLAYRAACRRANTLIDQSRKEHMRSELEACTDPRRRWTVAERLLHTNSNKKQLCDNVDSGLCDRFSEFFVSKIEQLRHNIACTLSGCQPSHPLPTEPSHTGPLIDTLQPVTATEVSKLL